MFELGPSLDLARLWSPHRAGDRCRIADPSRPWRLDGRTLTHSDVFVLTRKNDEARVVGAALRDAAVPYAYYKEDGLFQSDEAIEVRALLAAIDAPEDRSRRANAWLTRFFDLPLPDIDRARDLPPSHPFVSRLSTWKALADARDYDRLFEAIVVDSGVLRREIFFGDGERELTNYLHIFELLVEHTRQSRVVLTDLVHLLSGLIDKTRLPIDMEGNVQRLESDRRAVQIMTIHKAKGLEAPVVFLAGEVLRFPIRRPSRLSRRRPAMRLRRGPPRPTSRPGAAEEEREDEPAAHVRMALTRAIGPGVPSAAGLVSQGQPVKVRGPYESIHRRVFALIRAGNPLVSVEPLSVTAAPKVPVAANDTRPEAPPPPDSRAQAEDDHNFAVLRGRLHRDAGDLLHAHALEPGARAAHVLTSRDDARTRGSPRREGAGGGGDGHFGHAAALGARVGRLRPRAPRADPAGVLRRRHVRGLAGPPRRREPLRRGPGHPPRRPRAACSRRAARVARLRDGDRPPRGGAPGSNKTGGGAPGLNKTGQSTHRARVERLPGDAGDGLCPSSP